MVCACKSSEPSLVTVWSGIYSNWSHMPFQFILRWPFRSVTWQKLGYVSATPIPLTVLDVLQLFFCHIPELFLNWFGPPSILCLISFCDVVLHWSFYYEFGIGKRSRQLLAHRFSFHFSSNIHVFSAQAVTFRSFLEFCNTLLKMLMNG